MIAFCRAVLFWLLLLSFAVDARADVFNMPAGQVSLQTVPVGNPGNADDNPIPGYPNFARGSVSYNYSIGKYDVTVGQYTAFLNAVAATDTYALYDLNMATDSDVAGIHRNGAWGSYTYSVIGSPNKPIAYVSWGDAARFANWLSNGQPIGGQTLSTTEDGSYFLNGAYLDTALNAVTRKGTATWVIPTDDEWHKAAYYNPSTSSYYMYPYSSDTAPTSAMPGSTPNTGNFRSGSRAYAVTGTTYSNGQNLLSDVGAYTASASPSGAFDMGGDVLQWSEELSSSMRIARGGMWDGNSNDLTSSRTFGHQPQYGDDWIGFRLAFVGTILQPGDYNKDNHVNAADIKALELALTDLSTYKSTYGVSDADLVQINQLPGESTTALNNSDLQALLNYLKTGGGSANPVPEPSTLVLLTFGTVGVMIRRRFAGF